MLGDDATLSGGSSPHTRGALAEVDPGQVGPRIIPAYAGSTCRSRRRRPGRSDHPRIRGEHVDVAEQPHQCLGSSPHTRGARAPWASGSSGLRIIPAYAGSTRPCGAGRRRSADHPRIRGEHRLFTEYERRGGGSSPHTRGARFELGDDQLVNGIIPAYAGSTSRRCFLVVGVRDHPRIRGEHLPQTSCMAERQGSSPHTRGARGDRNYSS